MFCGKCGKEIKEGNLFCSGCGEKVELLKSFDYSEDYLQEIKNDFKKAKTQVDNIFAEVHLNNLFCYDKEKADYNPADLIINTSNVILNTFDENKQPQKRYAFTIFNNTIPISRISDLENGNIRVKIDDMRIIMKATDYIGNICSFANHHNMKMEEAKELSVSYDFEPWSIPRAFNTAKYEFSLQKIIIYYNHVNDLVYSHMFCVINDRANFQFFPYDGDGHIYNSIPSQDLDVSSVSCKITRMLDDGMLMVLLNDDIELILSEEEYSSLCNYISSKTS